MVESQDVLPLLTYVGNSEGNMCNSFYVHPHIYRKSLSVARLKPSGLISCGLKLCGLKLCGLKPCGLKLCGLKLCGLKPCGLTTAHELCAIF